MTNRTIASPRRHKLRRVVLASALVLSGAAIGAGGSALSQAPGWRDGPRDGVSDERPAPPWHGPWHRPMMGGQSGWHHHMDFGGPAFGPGSVERMVQRLVHATDASSEQRQKMNGIAQKAADDVLAMREKFRAGRRQMLAVLAAPTIDRARLESLRGEQMKLYDEASRRIATAVADIAEVLTPMQRADLGQRLSHRFDGNR